MRCWSRARGVAGRNAGSAGIRCFYRSLTWSHARTRTSLQWGDRLKNSSPRSPSPWGLARLLPFSAVMHDSPQAVGHRKRAIVGREREFERFAAALSTERVQGTGKTVMSESLAPEFRAEAVTRLESLTLKRSHLELIFQLQAGVRERTSSAARAGRKRRITQEGRCGLRIRPPVRRSPRVFDRRILFAARGTDLAAPGARRDVPHCEAELDPDEDLDAEDENVKALSRA